MVNITYQHNNEMVLAARVHSVTQLRREPASFGFGPWSEVVYSGPVPPNTTVNASIPMTTTVPLPTPTPSSGNKTCCSWLSYHSDGVVSPPVTCVDTVTVDMRSH